MTARKGGAALAVPLLLLALAGPARARDLWTGASAEGEESKLKLASALKATTVESAPSSDPSLASQGATNSSLLRLRLEPSFRAGPWVVDAAYDNHLSYASAPSLASSFAVPAYVPAPFRFGQVGGAIQSEQWAEAQELDRAFVSYARAPLEVTAGRQAIGWGRGKLFSAVDIFAPFAPLVVDQEWRRGVDALRADLRLTDTSSLEVVAAAGSSWSQAALGGRARGYVGPIDGELVVAKRAQDMLYGLTSSASIGGAEAHAELALFSTDGDTPSAGPFADQRLVPKAVAGVTHNFLVGSGLEVGAEYHYSGFGAATPSGLSPLLANPAFQSRLIRGDTQILGSQALGLLATYTFNERWSATLTVLQSLIDPSAVFAPSAVWTLSDSASLLGTVFAAYGATSQNGVFQSQFGAVPPTAILQLRLYD